MFALLKKRVSAEQLAKSLARYAIGMDACAAMVSMMQDHSVADEIAINECAFLRASYLRSIIGEHCNGEVKSRMNDAIEKEVIAAFSGKEKFCSREAAAYYRQEKMADVARARLTSYRELNDSLPMTSPIFCARLGARNIMMNVEVQAMLNDLLGPALRKSLKSVKPV